MSATVPAAARTWWFALLIGGASLAWGWSLYSLIDLSGWRYMRAESRVGVVDYCERTTRWVGGTPRERQTGTPIFRMYFSFVDSRGARRSGSSYLTGSCLDLGSQVRIEHPRGRPELARIVGLRAKPYSAWLGLLLLLPAAGLSLAIFSARLAMARRRPPRPASDDQ